MHSNINANEDLCVKSLDAALYKIAIDLGYKTIEEVKTVPVGARRKLHDDISIAFISLESQI
jgi:hypothetical protein